MNRQTLVDCHNRIKPFIHKTPVMHSGLLNEMAGAEVFFKCENFQKMGAFKMRGAASAITQLTADEKSRGVVTHSSGNFAQAVSLAARNLGIRAYIVMPENAPQVKKDAVAGYEGQIIECASTIHSREEEAARIVKEKGAIFLHPSNQLSVIVGQGTAAIELLDDHDDLDFIVVPVGGGGLIAGTALAAHYFAPECEVIGAEPFEVDDAFRSLEKGEIVFNETTNTIADGLRTHLGDINFPIIQKYVKRIIRVEEAEIVSAMRLIWERMKIVVEPSSAVAFAAILREKKFFENKQVGVVLSGGNVDLSRLPF